MFSALSSSSATFLLDGTMKDANEALSSQVLKTENGQVIAFWRGELVLKLDRAVRYFETEHQAWDFLARRETFANSPVASGNGRKASKLDR
jgi:hypothetical protein